MTEDEAKELRKQAEQTTAQKDFEAGYAEKGIVDTAKEKLIDAYDWQRQKREDHPVADFALNFIPGLGAAAAVDDVQSDIKKEDYKGAILDAVGLLPAGKLLSKGADAVMAADNAIRKSLVAKGYSAGDVNDVSTAFLSATGLSATSGAAAKTVDVVNNENKKSTEADKRAEEDFKEGYGKDEKPSPKK